MSTARSAGAALVVAALAIAAATGFAAGEAATDANPVLPGSRLSKADSSSEYWDLSVLLDSGHRVFARFTISNEGPGSETAYAIGQVVFPDGRLVAFKNGRLKGRWSISGDGLRIRIGSSILDLHEPLRRLEIDKNKSGQKIYLSFEASPEDALSWRTAPPDYRHDLLDNAVPASGTLWIRGQTEEPVPVVGVMTLTHTSMEETETERVLRRVELHSGAGGDALYLIDVLASKSSGGGSKRWLVARRAGEPVFQTDDFELEYVGSSAESRSAYPVPARLVVRGPKVNGEITLGALQVRHNPLDIAPQPFRFLLGLLMDPNQMWFTATSALTITQSDGQQRRVESPGAVSFSFVNEMR